MASASQPLQPDGQPACEPIASERELVAICAALGAAQVAGWSADEQALVAGGRAPVQRQGQEVASEPAAPWTGARPCPVSARRLAAVGAAIRGGADVLGDAFAALRSPAERRPVGATYTPAVIVDAMLARAQGELSPAHEPAQIIDPGCGSGRFLVAAGRAFPRARLVGVDIEPMAALMTRAHLACAGMAGRAHVAVADYRHPWATAAPAEGPVLFIGNPPYVRHHQIERPWKRWLSQRAAAHGLRASQLAGLHIHFFLATLERARPGDLGVLVTSAEWLDVGYGQLARDLLAGPLGCLRIDILEPTAQAFADAQTTAAITCFRVGSAAPAVYLRRVATAAELMPLGRGRRVARQRLARSPRWSPLSRRPARSAPGLVQLGELCRVHRGQVTGANHVWIAGPDTPPLPAAVLFPAITRARELFAAAPVLTDPGALRRVIDVPAELDILSAPDRDAVMAFLRWARQRGGHQSYIARHRSPWWAVKLREPPPILATYMARRPPAFVRNRAGARFINIAHGIYPRAPLPEPYLDTLAAYLSASVSPAAGRTYAGGLTKFEPGEMARLLVPAPG